MNPVRSALFVPADHERAMAGALARPADALIFDLEDGVSPAHKPQARDAAARLLATAPTSAPLRILRINHRDTPYYAEDMAMACTLPLDGLMLSKTSGADDIADAIAQLGTQGRADLAIWCNVETPRGIAEAFAIAAHPAVRALVAGTNDLANDLRIRRTADRAGLLHSLERLQLAARAYDRLALDGTFIDLTDARGLEAEAQQGRMLGFDGKTLIHPSQIDVANRIFSPSGDEIAEAHAIIEAYEAAMKEQKEVTLLNGRMIERLHYVRALSLASASPRRANIRSA